jgi:hypothetical protein
MKQIVVALTIVASLLSGCAAGPSAEQIQGTVVAQVTALAQQATPYPTYTPRPTYTPAPTVAVEVEVTVLAEVTRIIIVTPTATATPEFTATPEIPPDQMTATARAEVAQATATAKAESTAIMATAIAHVDAEMKAPHAEGFWIVGVDIAPGLWRNDGTEDNCYWERSTKTGDIIDNHFGAGGGTAYLRATDFQFQARNCGTWTWLSD